MQRLSPVLLSALLFAAPAFAANPRDVAPPAQITRATYAGWLRAAGSATSPFLDYVFSWYEQQLQRPIPAQVASDPDKIYVSVDQALQQTIELEGNGDVEEGNTIGFDAYSIIDVPIQVALETKLFNWGKPIGQRSGDTYPYDSVFSQVHNQFLEKWGPGNYYSRTDQTGGGLVQSLHDDYTVLVRGDARNGYVMFMSYFGPAGNQNTPTQYHVSIVMMKPTADGKTEYRQCVRQNGQSYKVFGLEYGRRNFGFNVSKVRAGEKALNNTMLELKNTGRIRENRPNLFLE